MQILLLSPYDALSHQYWRLGLVAALPAHDFEVMTLPARHFSWRFRGNSLTLSQDPRLGSRYDLIIATSMTDVATLKGIRPSLAQVPAVVYFHENQFVYPSDSPGEHLVERQITSLYTAIAAGHLVFNSEYNRSSFFDGAQQLLSKMPDGVPPDVIGQLRSRSSVMPVPLGEECYQRHESTRRFNVVWNHRWEYDKGLLELQELVVKTLSAGIDVKFHVIGQSSAKPGAIMSETLALLQEAGQLGEEGYIESRQAYLELLAQANCVLSTTRHEFQGLAVQEAMASGCIPVVPDALVYPEYVPSEYRYQGIEQAVELFRKIKAGLGSPTVAFARWDEQALQWQALIEALTQPRLP